MNLSRLTRPVAVLTAALVVLAGGSLAGAGPAQAARLVPISGVGSSWSAIAISAWVAQVKRTYQIEVQYEPSGSSNGRKQFGSGVADFGVSEIPYGLTDGGTLDSPPQRKFAYMPIVAGGTSFMYNLSIGGKRVTALRLSGDAVVKIFTGAVTTWNDPVIAADNPGLTLPARRIVPVVRSDGSGTTAQFTTWMSKRYTAAWNAYCTRAGRTQTPCGVTSIYPTISGMVAQAGSTGVAGYVQQPTAEGAITYVEYGYAKDANFPVVSLLNKAGYYTQPTAANVAVALQGATLNTDEGNPATYLTQILDGVYDNADARAYPLSSYSYMILPTSTQSPMTTDKGYTLGKFGYYFLCQGQQSVTNLGYSPLPKNLVQAGFDQLKKVPGVVAEDIKLDSCNNPAFSKDPNSKNGLVDTAPQPESCQKQGPTQCGTKAVAAAGGGTPTPSRTATTPGTTPAAGATPGATPGASAPAGGVPGGAVPGASSTVDPDTGQTVPVGVPAGAVPSGAAADPGAGNPGAAVAAGPQAESLPISLAAEAGGGPVRTLLMILSAVLLIGVALAPPLVAHWTRRTRS